MATQLGFYFDQQYCIGCDACRVACKVWNGLKAGPVSFRKRVTVESGSMPNLILAHVVTGCNHCESPACASVCPSGAIKKRVSDGAVLVNPFLCVGCQACKGACPYSVPQFEYDNAKMQKCNLCADRLADINAKSSSGKQPACVASCPQRAIEFGSMEDLKRNHPTAAKETAGFVYDDKTKPSIIFKRKL